MTADVLAFSFPNPFKLLGTVLSPILDLGGELMGASRSSATWPARS